MHQSKSWLLKDNQWPVQTFWLSLSMSSGIYQWADQSQFQLNLVQPPETEPQCYFADVTPKTWQTVNQTDLCDFQSVYKQSDIICQKNSQSTKLKYNSNRYTKM